MSLNESIVLGCCVLDPDHVDKAIEAGLTPEHFTVTGNKALWKAFLGQRIAGKGLDLLTISVAMGNATPFEQFTAAENAAPTSVNFKPSLEAVLWGYKAAKLSEATTVLATALSAGKGPESVLASLNELNELAADQKDGKAADIETVSKEVEKVFQDAIDGRPDMRKSYPLPLKDFTHVFGPVYQQEFVLVAARPSVGKTSFCVQMATECCRAGYKVAYIATEASAAQVISQMASQEARVNLRALNQEFPEKLKKAKTMVSAIRDSKRLKIYDRDLSITAIKHRCRMLSGWADIVFIDHLAQISNPGKSRYESVSDTCHQMVEIQKILQVPLILAHQLKRIEANGIPGLQDLRDSGAAEEDASRIILIHFPTDGFNGTPQVGLQVEAVETRDYYVTQAKHRYGVRDVSVRCHYHAPTTRFEHHV